MRPEKTVCYCRRVTIGDMEQAVKDGARSFEEVQEVTKVSTGCKKCLDYAKNVAKELLEENN